MSSNRKKLILKFLSILPQFIFKRIINKFDLDQQNKNVEPSFSEIVSNCENINKSLFDGENELFKKYLDKSKCLALVKTGDKKGLQCRCLPLKGKEFCGKHKSKVKIDDV